MKKNKKNHRFNILLLGPGLYLSGYKTLKKILNKQKFNQINFKISNNHNDISQKYNLVFSFGYRKIIPNNYLRIPKKGVIIFHSSDLPRGKGWAPLYHALVEKRRKHTVSMFFANKKIDSGNIIAKAKCNIEIDDTLKDLRKKDDYLVAKLFEKYLLKLLRQEVLGKKQSGKQTFNRRRYPQDSKINIGKPLKQSFLKLRALDNEKFPGFFTIRGRKFYLKLFPEKEKQIKKINYKIIDFSKNTK